jgi:RNA polymerase sigma-70 factor (ECF subfamily)
LAATDPELVRAALGGSEHAFRDLVQRYERAVFSVILRVVRDPSRAEELAQDAFVKAFRRLDSYAPDRKFASWLLAIAHHTAVDEVRRGIVRTEPLENHDHYRFAHPDGETPATIAERREAAAALETAIRRLRPEYAELINLRYEQEHTLEEIAEITTLPIGTIKSYLHRARKDLAEQLRLLGIER